MFPVSEKGSTLKEKNLPPVGSIFFPYKVDLFSEGAQFEAKQPGSKNKLSPLEEDSEQSTKSTVPLEKLDTTSGRKL